MTKKRITMLDAMLEEHGEEDVTLLVGDNPDQCTDHLARYNDTVVIITTRYNVETGVTDIGHGTSGNWYACQASIAEMLDIMQAEEDTYDS